jgi:thymidylate kinase
MLEVSTQEQPMLNLISQLCDALENEGINYCHWKSNAAIDRSATGDNDLDLLISRSHVQRFTEVVYRLNFKEARAPAHRDLPGVLSFYGYDNQADRWVHIHAHYQLVLGHDMSKNYRLPVEEPFLASARRHGLLRVPAPEFELILFVIRMMLKYSTWDAVLSRRATMPAKARHEFDYLRARIDLDRLYDILGQHVPYVEPFLFDACVRSLQPDCSNWSRIKVAQQLQKSLQAHARRPYFVDVYLKFWRRVIHATRRRILGRTPKNRLTHGGMMIAVIGGDGAGKSTAVAELFDWTSRVFDSIAVHLGKPPWSWTTYAVRGSLKAVRLLRTYLRGKGRPESFQTPWYARMLWEVCAARDRQRLYAKARRFATNGGLVICDRFPLRQIKLMDGPQVQRLLGVGQRTRFTRFLMWLEDRYYRSISEPEVLIVLKVDPEIAVRRKTEENPITVRNRCQEIWELDWQGTRAHVVDANRPRTDVLADVRSIVWMQT